MSGDIATPQPEQTVPGVDGQVDARRHPPSRRCPRAREARWSSRSLQLAEVKLAPRLEPDHEEEGVIRPLLIQWPQRLGDPGVADPDRQRGVPDAAVRRRVHVRPDQGRRGRPQQDGRAAGLGAQEGAERRLEARAHAVRPENRVTSAAAVRSRPRRSYGVSATAASGVATRKLKLSSRYRRTASTSCSGSRSRGPRRTRTGSGRRQRCRTTAPSTPGAQVNGPPTISRRCSRSG